MLRIVETGAAADQAALAVIMLHGRGRAPEEMVELAAALAVDGVRYFCPEAPENSWYPQRFIDPFEHNQPALDASLAGIAALIFDLNGRGFPDNRIVLCGFSRGAVRTGREAVDHDLSRPSAHHLRRRDSSRSCDAGERRDNRGRSRSFVLNDGQPLPAQN
jgi:alpha-beta hydrolase superfamily lysophospholipase